MKNNIYKKYFLYNVKINNIYIYIYKMRNIVYNNSDTFTNIFTKTFAPNSFPNTFTNQQPHVADLRRALRHAMARAPLACL